MTEKDYKDALLERAIIRKAVKRLEVDPTYSESISTPNGGSRSVSYAQLTNLTSRLTELDTAINTYRRSITAPGGMSVNYVRWC